MNEQSAMKLQKSLGVMPDGVIGRKTLAALFRKLGAIQARADELGLAANVHFNTYGILDTPLRLAHCMAQLAHESGGFRYMEEIASGVAYEGRADLGNTQPGDGMRYKGRGPIQLTGRTNYRKTGQALGIDFENNPAIVAMPSIGLLVACKYWDDKRLNSYADQDDIKVITKLINGGYNGLTDRENYLKIMKVWLGV